MTFLRNPLRGPDRPADAGAAGDSWRAGVKPRITVILCALAFWTVVIEARLVQMQVFQHDDYVARALDQQQKIVKLAGQRGGIVDRNGEILGYSVKAKTIIADPSKVEDAKGTAAAICKALEDCDAAKQASLVVNLERDSSFAWVARQVSEAQAARVMALDLPGIALSPVDETRRYYPKVELAAQLLGFVDVDNKGGGGIESAYDSVIRGKDGRMLVQKDARLDRRFNRMQTLVQEPPTTGATVELTIDQYLQSIAEREVRAGVEAHHARTGTAIIMDPHTGELLAFANYPTFNPNAPGQSSQEAKKNIGVQDVYEPGSTFKIVTASAALQEGVLTTTDLIDCSPGWVKIGSRKPIEDSHAHGVLSFEDVIVVSSNVGAVKAGLRVGAEKLNRYIQRYGFGQRLSPDFSGASPGILTPPSRMNDSAVASMSMGYQISVTPLQMATAVSAVANGGVLMEPHLVRAIIKDGTRRPVEPKALREAVRPDIAATLTTIMEEVVNRGTGEPAKLDGYQVAGKTGTAHNALPNGGGYSETEYHASFVGFVPSRSPVFTIVVVVDRPSDGFYYGATIAAPIFKKIADASLRYAGVAPTINPLPPVMITTTSDEPTLKPVRATSILPALREQAGPPVRPDVRGLSARDAVKVLTAVGLSPRVSGLGFVAAQTPAPGTPLDSASSSSIELQRIVPEPKKGSGGQ